MSMSVGASSNALSYLQSLLAQGTAGAGIAASADPLSSLLGSLSGAPADAPACAPASTATAAATSTFDPGTLAALISLQGQLTNGAQGPSSLFAKLDSNGDGQVSQSEFETALGNAGVDQSSADALFAKLDANGDGSISQSELTQAQHAGGHHHHHMHAAGAQGGGSSGQDAASLLSSTDASGATTQTTTNADGSSTTTITYADGSTVEMTSPTTASNGSGASDNGATGQNSANLIERLIQMQAQLLNTAASTISAVA